ncbi:hypothetical protein BC940DRAFT_333362 [Gongronella butleri]|nr:hypothetical protein BC940DRAFT_333362 [Gongronella butleri]
MAWRARYVENKWSTSYLLLAILQVLITVPLLVVVCTNTLSHYNTLTIITSNVLTLLSMIFGIVSASETIRLLVRISDPSDNATLHQSLNLQIALAVVLGVLLIPTTYFVYRLYMEYGWHTYKKMGANVQKQRMYAVVSAFTLALKLGAFFECLTMIFYVAISAYAGPKVNVRQIILCSIVVVFCIGALVLGRKAVANESMPQIITFVVAQLLFIATSIAALVLFGQTIDSQRNPFTFMRLYGACSIAVAVLNIVLSLWCLRNFGQGLQPHVQWRVFGRTPTMDLNENRSMLLDEEDLVETTLADHQQNLLTAIHEHRASPVAKIEQ